MPLRKKQPFLYMKWLHMLISVSAKLATKIVFLSEMQLIWHFLTHSWTESLNSIWLRIDSIWPLYQSKIWFKIRHKCDIINSKLAKTSGEFGIESKSWIRNHVSGFYLQYVEIGLHICMIKKECVIQVVFEILPTICVR